MYKFFCFCLMFYCSIYDLLLYKVCFLLTNKPCSFTKGFKVPFFEVLKCLLRNRCSFWKKWRPSSSLASTCSEFRCLTRFLRRRCWLPFLLSGTSSSTIPSAHCKLSASSFKSTCITSYSSLHGFAWAMVWFYPVYSSDSW